MCLRYRLVNNTFILQNNADGLRAQDELETVELYNNIFIKAASKGSVFDEADAQWVNSRRVRGANNYIQRGLTNIPGGLTGTLAGADAALNDIAAGDLTLKANSTLANAGIVPDAFACFEFPFAFFPPAFHPPVHKLIAPGSATARPVNGVIDVGAFEK